MMVITIATIILISIYFATYAHPEQICSRYVSFSAAPFYFFLLTSGNIIILYVSFHRFPTFQKSFKNVIFGIGGLTITSCFASVVPEFSIVSSVAVSETRSLDMGSGTLNQYSRSIPTYDLFSRVQRLEDTMLTKADGKEMEKRAEERMDAMERRADEKMAAMDTKTNIMFSVTTLIALYAAIKDNWKA